MAAFTRPDGRTYRPRKQGLRAHAWENDHPGSYGVIVLGTNAPETAQAFADQCGASWYGEGRATAAQTGWWRDGYDSHGRAWIVDERRGVPGVMFTWEAA